VGQVASSPNSPSRSSCEICAYLFRTRLRVSEPGSPTFCITRNQPHTIVPLETGQSEFQEGQDRQHDFQRPWIHQSSYLFDLNSPAFSFFQEEYKNWDPGTGPFFASPCRLIFSPRQYGNRTSPFFGHRLLCGTFHLFHNKSAENDL